MKTYETLLIAKPTIDKDGLATLIKKVTTAISKNGGEPVKTSEWGVRRLSYEIKKHKDGCYLLFEFGGALDTVKKVQDFLKLQPDVIRFMTTKKPRPPKGGVVAPVVAGGEAGSVEAKSDVAAQPRIDKDKA